MGKVKSMAWIGIVWTLTGVCLAEAPSITPSAYWKNQIAFQNDPFCSYVSAGSTWIKFTILTEPYDPNLVYFQNSKKYKLHYDFASQCLNPFIGMSSEQFYAATVTAEHPSAVLGTVLLPPTHGTPPVADVNEYGIQFVRYDREQIRDLFARVKASVIGPPDIRALFFPTFEQQAAAQADLAWFEAQGIPVGSMARWAKGNTCYSQGWALGRLKYFTADQISQAYQAGDLEPNDILLTDGVPPELPLLAGLISLSPSTPNSHVALLFQGSSVPFVYAALQADVDLARNLTGHRILFSAYVNSSGVCQSRLIDTEGVLDDALIVQILALKQPASIHITPMASYGAYAVPTEGLMPSDVKYVGGKAVGFGVLRAAVPANSPKAVALTFDLWNAFLQQTLVPAPTITLAPGAHILFWADKDVDQGPTHVGFRLSKGGGSIGLFDTDGKTRLDAVTYGPQKSDVSYGRSVDGGDAWQPLSHPSPGRPNSSDPSAKGRGLVINELMASNKKTLQDPNEPGQYPDWFEIYNGSDQTVSLNGLFLTNDMNDPTLWQVPPSLKARTLRQEIAERLSKYGSPSLPPSQELSGVLGGIRALFTDPYVTRFNEDLRTGVMAVLTDPVYGFDANAMLRFRSSTNVEDSAEFTAAGLFDSFSGCLADDQDGDNRGPCRCDPNSDEECGVFQAIRQTFASFYNDNGYLERRHYDINEALVGMAMVVHHSFPNELANGVATFDCRAANANPILTLVTQLGELSVTNPPDASTPETVILKVLNGTVTLGSRPGTTTDTAASMPVQSDLVPLGATVMDWPGDYKTLAGLLIKVSNEFARVRGETSYALDMEYKKVRPGDITLPSGGLVIKQVRPLPEPNQTADLTPFLVNVPMDFEVFTGECVLLQDTIDVFAAHRLKSRWHLETRNMALDTAGLRGGIYGQVTIEALDEDHTYTVSDPMDPLATHGFDGTTASDTWRWADLANPRTVQLLTKGVHTVVSSAENPIFILGDLGIDAYTPFRVLAVDVTYDEPVTAWSQSPGSAGLRQTLKNRIYLWPRQAPDANDLLQERTVDSNGVTIHTSFYYPPPPLGWASWVGATAPLKRWKQTVIEGLTAEPIVLEGYWSQTYRPEHHNVVEHLLFEPRLEPGISPTVLDELKGKDIRFIHAIINHQEGGQSALLTYGSDAAH
jgi:hypothetical protein